MNKDLILAQVLRTESLYLYIIFEDPENKTLGLRRLTFKKQKKLFLKPISIDELIADMVHNLKLMADDRSVIDLALTTQETLLPDGLDDELILYRVSNNQALSDTFYTRYLERAKTPK